MNHRKGCARIFRAAMSLSLNKAGDALSKLQGVEAESYEKDILMAQTLFSTQDYKRYYL